jgi:hypothetical protein
METSFSLLEIWASQHDFEEIKHFNSIGLLGFLL